MMFGYREALALCELEVAMQLARTRAGNPQPLHIPILVGPVGLGKTSIGSTIADALDLPFRPINNGETSDPTEYSVPMPSPDSPYMQWKPSETLYEATQHGVLLFFDDIDKSPPLVEGALLSLFANRTVRNLHLHPETVIMAAGNRVNDDVLARALSESLKTRGTIINVEPRLADFEAYAQHTAKDKMVHPAVIGFLRYRPHLLHRHDPDADRFPTPRGWVEASAGLHKHDDGARLFGKTGPRLWQTTIALKCGEPTAHDFIAWYDICARIDVQVLLREGKLEYSFDPKEEAIVPYAVAFAVSQELNSGGVKKVYQGFARYLKGLEPEHRVALYMQLSAQAQRQLGQHLPEAASIMLRDVVMIEGEASAAAQ